MREYAKIGTIFVGSFFCAADIALPKPFLVSPVIISAIISILKERAKLEAKPTRIYGIASGSLTLKAVPKNEAPSTRVASIISDGTFDIPEDIDSYKIGKEINITM